MNPLFEKFDELHAKKVVVVGGNLLATEIATKLSYKAYQRDIPLEIVQVFPERSKNTNYLKKL